MLSIQGLSYAYPNEELLFRDVNLTLQDRNKISLIGNNGSGKSTFLRIVMGLTKPLDGTIFSDTPPFYVPQHFGQFEELPVADAMQVGEKLQALREILDGNVSANNYLLVDDDWTIQERCNQALQHWGLTGMDLGRKMGSLSGGEKTRVFLSAITIHQPRIVLLDEPSNHLDGNGRELLYAFIRSTKSSLIVVSHDRELLNLLNTTCELGKEGIVVYGGNYDFYAAQKEIEKHALALTLRASEKALRKARETERKVMEQQQRSDSRGKGKQDKAGVARIMMNTLRNKAENSTSKTKDVHSEKIAQLSQQLQALRSNMVKTGSIKLEFMQTGLHGGKVLFDATGINYRYDGQNWIWKNPLDIHITTGERVAISGQNGSGKTTLVKIIVGELNPQQGNFYRAKSDAICIDQDYSLIDNQRTVYQQAQQFNNGDLSEHEVKARLNRFLFGQAHWDQYCSHLSGGEKMRLTLCCLTVRNRPPDIVILDEPTNNLDIQNIEVLSHAVQAYEGTIIIISHDVKFVEKAGVKKIIELDGA
ncbi:ABC-F family ATP-binding cassette domain-containing protein [Sediminibacterium roseum]|uniref:ABC-F family ATP-binding cassette domain-containing protein n=1 Tax=Sediminibacterium roseum TaxID=1978412 RepID=A0ABW9ZT58_9BACT|nr:ABC-F family ATP-binding cassette domain-containing protein [Sediminibacterium roseum]NCI50306.1 ABC-F family ATP-binding cassette domain-containing protein [Sediminibacterium roseum]